MTPQLAKRTLAATLGIGYVLLCGLSLASIAEELCTKRGGRLVDAGYDCAFGDSRLVTVFSLLSWPQILLTTFSYGVVTYILWARLGKRFDSQRRR